MVFCRNKACVTKICVLMSGIKKNKQLTKGLQKLVSMLFTNLKKKNPTREGAVCDVNTIIIIIS